MFSFHCRSCSKTLNPLIAMVLSVTYSINWAQLCLDFIIFRFTRRKLVWNTSASSLSVICSQKIPSRGIHAQTGSSAVSLGKQFSKFQLKTKLACFERIVPSTFVPLHCHFQRRPGVPAEAETIANPVFGVCVKHELSHGWTLKCIVFMSPSVSLFACEESVN